MTDPAPALASSLADRYRFERELGQGGMARVYLATDLKHRRSVAIKVLLPEIAAIVGADRFLREIALLASFQHPNIIPLFDSGEVNGEPYYVMPYVEGETLRERLAREGRLGVHEVVRIVREVASALDAAHRRGIVHRDIKPGNILLSDGHALVADFGIARAIASDPVASERLTTTGMSIGTPGYMSPEQVVADRDVDARSDVYALGAVAYEMLAGHPPIVGPSAAAVVAQVLTNQPPPLTAVRRGTPSGLSQAVQRALAIERSDRFPTVTGFAEALERGSGTASDEDGPGRTRRRWLLVAGGLVAAATAAVWLARRPAGADDHPSGVRVAVLPFREAGDTTNPGFVLGLTTTIRRDLATLPGVEVVAGTSIEALGDSVRTPRYIQQQLGATHVLSGVVQWTRGPDRTMRVAVTPEAIDLRQAREVAIAGKLITERVDELFRTQARVSAEVARSLGISISADAVTRLAAPPTRNRGAYEAYLQARIDTVGGTTDLERAVALDSTFTAAWIDLALAAVYEYRTNFQPAAAELASRAAARAMRLDSANAFTRVAAMMAARHITRDIDAAVRQAKEAIRLAPGNPDVLTLASGALFVGRRFDDALTVARRAAELDPRSASALARVANLLTWQHDFVGAQELTRKAVAIDSEAGYINVGAVWLALMKGDTVGARAVGTSRSDKARSDIAVIADLDWLLGWALDSTTSRLGAERFRREGDQLYYYVGRTRDAWRRGDRVTAGRFADSVASEAVPRIQALRGEERMRLALGYSLALGGRCPEAVAQADTVHRTKSAWTDGFFGPGASLTRAQILAVCGERRHAVVLLDSLLRLPGLVTPAWLAIDPHFAAIRTDPEFRVLAGLASGPTR